MDVEHNSPHQKGNSNNEAEPPSIRNLTKNYGTLTMVKNVRLDIELGEIFGLLEPKSFQYQVKSNPGFFDG